MDLHQRQQFGFLLQTATERYVARLEERFRGPDVALTQFQAEPEGEGVWLSQFTDAIFEDFLLNNIDGACFVLQALPKRKIEPGDGDTVEAVLIRIAKTVFAELLQQKTIELLEQHAGYQPV